MGNTSSRDVRGAAEAELMQTKKVDRNPIRMTVQRGEEENETHTVLTVPKTNYKIMYVDPQRRGDVIPTHGYVALQHTQLFQRSEARDDLHKTMFGADAKKMRDEIGGSSDDEKDPLSFNTGGYEFPIEGEDAINVDGQKFTKFTKSEDPLEFESMRGEHNFPPAVNKEKKMRKKRVCVRKPKKKLGAGFGGKAGALGFKNDEFADDDEEEQEFEEVYEETSEWETDTNPSENENKDLPSQEIEVGGLFAGAQGLQLTELGAKQDDDMEGLEFGNHARSRSRSRSRSNSESSSNSSKHSVSHLDTENQKFFFPTGRAIKDRVFFMDTTGALGKSFSSSLEPSLGAAAYEKEEDEIHEMAGVHRLTHRKKDVDDDPLSTYHPQCDVLEALYIAIDTPMADIRTENVVGEDQTEDELKMFRDAAMKEAKQLFDNAQQDLFAFTQAQSSPRLLAGEATSARLLKTGGAAATFRFGGTATMAGTATLDTTKSAYNIRTHDHNGNEFTPEEMQQQKVNERKKLHKMLNKWKSNFNEANGRAPEAHELASDPGIADVFSAYKRLKKETKEEVKETLIPETVPEPSETPATSLQGTQQFSPENLPEGHRKSLAPITPEAKLGEGPTLEEKRERKRELKRLQKIVKQWKKEFKSTEGRAPTKRDIRGNETVGPVYEEVKRLEALIEADGDVETGSERDEQEVQLTTGAPTIANEQPATPTNLGEVVDEKLLSEVHEIENTEAMDRRELEADENIEFRGLLRKADQERPAMEKAFEESVNNIDLAAVTNETNEAPAESEAPAAAKDSDQREVVQEASLLAQDLDEIPPPPEAKSPTPFEKPKPKVATGWGVASPSPTNEDVDEEAGTTARKSVAFASDPEEERKALVKRRKHLGKELNAWKANFQAMNGREPTLKDIKNDPEIGPTYEEYSSIPKDLGKDKGAERAGSPDMDHAAPESNEALESKSVAKRRKQLAKELNKWKKVFAIANGKEPTTKDILADDEIRGVYEEYISLKSEKEDESAANPPSEKDTKKRRKELGKKLNHWKKEFVDNNGRDPTETDINNDPEIALVFQEYTSLCGGESNEPGTNEDNQTQQTSVVSSPPSKANKKLKKALGKQLNEWKANFEEEFGRKPKVADIKADAEIAAVYDQYTALVNEEKGISGSEHLDETTTNLGVTTANLVAEVAAEKAPQVTLVPPTEEGDVDVKKNKKLKKQLKKQLEDWKENFKEENGIAPTQEDINNDAEILAVQKQISDLKDKLGGTMTPNTSRSPSRERTPSKTNFEEEEEAMDPKVLAQKRKTLAKQLNKWKTQFLARTGEHPTKDDIDADPTIKDIFYEYQAIPKDLGGTMGSQAESRPTTAVESAPPAAEGTVDDELAASQKEQIKALKHQKKALSKELNAWKEKFTEANGRAPKKSDITGDIEVSALYEELEMLKDQISQLE